MLKKFKRKLPVYKIVAIYKHLPQIPYSYVEQLTIGELVNFILRKQRSLGDSEIQDMVKWLQSSPRIYNSSFKVFKLYKWF